MAVMMYGFAQLTIYGTKIIPKIHNLENLCGFLIFLCLFQFSVALYHKHEAFVSLCIHK